VRSGLVGVVEFVDFVACFSSPVHSTSPFLSRCSACNVVPRLTCRRGYGTTSLRESSTRSSRSSFSPVVQDDHLLNLSSSPLSLLLSSQGWSYSSLPSLLTTTTTTTAMLTSALSFTSLALFFLTFFSASEPVSASFPHDLSRRQFGRFGQGRNNGGAGAAAAGAGCPPLTMIVARASTEAPGEGTSSFSSLLLLLKLTIASQQASSERSLTASRNRFRERSACAPSLSSISSFLTLLFTLAGRRRLPRHSWQLRQLGSARSRRHVRIFPSSTLLSLVLSLTRCPPSA
jgi:hypothetical protein